MGKKEEQAGHELRQTVPFHPSVLQERHHEENRAITATSLPVLPSLFSLKTCAFIVALSIDVVRLATFRGDAEN